MMVGRLKGFNQMGEKLSAKESGGLSKWYYISKYMNEFVREGEWRDDRRDLWGEKLFERCREREKLCERCKERERVREREKGWMNERKILP